MENEQYKFINSEVWSLTIGGAFQRSGVYKKGVTDKQKKEFKTALKKKVDTLVEEHYTTKLGDVDKKHLSHIQELIKWSKAHSSVLSGGKLNLGIAQKLFNLYLKYLWCLEKYPEPPHFPVDRIIQTKMKGEIISWTKLDSEKEYKKIIKRAREIALKQGKSLAEWELIEFSRRADS